MKKVKRMSVLALLLAFCLCGIFIAQAATAGTYKWQNTTIKNAVSLYQSGDYYYAATASAIYKVDSSGNAVNTYTGLSNITSMTSPISGPVVFVASGGSLYQVNVETSAKIALNTSPNLSGIKKISRSSSGTYAISTDSSCYLLNSSLIVNGSIPYNAATETGVFATSDGGALVSFLYSGQYLVYKVNSNGSVAWFKYGLSLPSNPLLPNGNYLLMNVNASGQNYGFSEITAANGSTVKTLASSTRFYNVIYAGTSSGNYQYFASFVDGGSVQNGRLDATGNPTWQIAGWSYSVMVAASDGSLVGGNSSMLASSYLKLLQFSIPSLTLSVASATQSSSESPASQANAGVESSTSETANAKSDAPSSQASDSASDSDSDSSGASIFSPDKNDAGGSEGVNVWMIATIALLAAGAIATFVFVILPRIRGKKPPGPRGPHNPQEPGEPQWPQDAQGMQPPPAQWQNPAEQPPQGFHEYQGRQPQDPQDIQPPQPPQ